MVQADAAHVQSFLADSLSLLAPVKQKKEKKSRKKVLFKHSSHFSAVLPLFTSGAIFTVDMLKKMRNCGGNGANLGKGFVATRTNTLTKMASYVSWKKP